MVSMRYIDHPPRLQNFEDVFVGVERFGSRFIEEGIAISSILTLLR